MSQSKNNKPVKGWSKIVKKLNVLDEFREIGFEFPDDNPTSKGYVSCWAYDRPHGDSPSAGVNINTGWYKDHGGTGQGAYLYQLRSHLGYSASVEDAIKYYASKTGMGDEIADHLQSQMYAEDQVSDRDFNPVIVHRFFERRPEILPEVLIVY